MKLENLKKPLIFEYTDYRAFLADLYEYLKQTTDFFSFRYFSKKAGYKSPNYLKLVIQGDRNISEDSMERFCEALKLKKKESDFFKKLVLFNQATKPKEKAEFALKILTSKIYQKLNPLTSDQLDYYRNWYQIGIRELSLCGNIKNNPEKIAKLFRPELKVKEVERAIESLTRLGMLKTNKKGFLEPASQNVTTHGEVISTQVAHYHREMMEKAKESIDLTKAMEREISSICVPVSQKTFSEMKSKIQEFKKELIALASQDADPDQVYQLNLQLFPLTNRVDKS